MRAETLLAGFSFVDKVHVLARNERIEATWRFEDAAWLLASHFPLRPMVPGSLVLEAFAQAGSLLLEASGGFARKALPVLLDRVRFRRPVRGDRPVETSVTAIGGKRGEKLLEAAAHQDGLRAATAKLGFVLAPIADYYGPQHLGAYRGWVEARLASARLIDFPKSPLEMLREFGC